MTHVDESAFARDLLEYNIVYDKSIRNTILDQIRSQAGTFLYCESRAKSVWRIKINHKTIVVVYNTKLKKLVKVLSSDNLDDNLDTQKLIEHTNRYWGKEMHHQIRRDK